MSWSVNRYHRQMLLPGIGEAGQHRLGQSHALVVGCGALGSVIIDGLARAGIGTLTIIDRDIVELTNLQRQMLYDENDVRDGTPKAIAAKRRIEQINSAVTVNAWVDDFNHRNAAKFIGGGVDILLDGLDNFETRYLLNDLAVKHGLPYIYGGAVATTGVSMTVLPQGMKDRRLTIDDLHAGNDVDAADRQLTFDDRPFAPTPCLRCVFPEAPPPGVSPTCDTAGVLGPAVTIIAAWQVTQAIKILTGNIDAVDRSLLSIDLWSNEIRRFDISGTREHSDCICCVQRRFEFLEGAAGSSAVSMCGRNAVQIVPAAAEAANALNLAAIATRLAPHGCFTHNEFLLRGEFTGERNSHQQPIQLTLFPNGRAIVHGVSDVEAARSIYARYIGT